MDNYTPSSEFEKKVELAASAPSPDPKFVERLRMQMTAVNEKPKPQVNDQKQLFTTNLFSGRGVKIKSTRLMAFAMAALALVVAVGSFFVLNKTTQVSAQQILARASAVQSAAKTGKGIWYNHIEIYENPEALAGDHPGIQTFIDDYFDMVNGYNRRVTQDSKGKVLEASASDGTTDYFSTGSAIENLNSQPLVIHRSPAVPRKPKPVCSTPQPDGNTASAPAPGVICTVDPSTDKNSGTNDRVGDERAEFEQFSKNPRVVLQGKETLADGTKAYILVDNNYETSKAANNQDGKTYTGSMKMVFDAQTYKLIKSERTIRKDNQDIIIETVRFLTDEILPLDTHIVWNLSDLKDVKFVDDQKADNSTQVQTTFKVISEHELAAHIQAYVLKTIPDGYTQEIVFAPCQEKGESDSFEIHYNEKGETVLGFQYVGVLGTSFIQTSFYDGSYKTASGLVLNFGTGGSSGVLIIPNGTSFLVTFSLPREKVEALAEDLVPAK